MKLNHDCVRDLLLTVEDTEHGVSLPLDDLFQEERLRPYSNNDVVYTVQRLKEAGYLNVVDANTYDGYEAFINHITWNGHQFLDNIRDKTVWEKTKEKASIVGSVSLPILSELAKTYIADMLGLKS
ncbi:hypothetical protein BK704_28820 [[Bacillus thuringiensis] serovar konkukian]|nr:DUF2513 domain-containing protein [Bacillus thuringiensis]MED1303684.1 DUF2513 domain-containing protein [Bacillus pacificus]OUA94860.1 hypothetical protein BK704_28820 [[Bacillus thuringiensis] serovar konkukian]